MSENESLAELLDSVVGDSTGIAKRAASRIRTLEASLLAEKGKVAALENDVLRKFSALNAAAGWLSGYCPDKAKHLIERIDAALATTPAPAETPK